MTSGETSLSTGRELLEPEAVQNLLTRAQREIDQGLLPAVQLAVAREGEVVLDVTLGDATADTRFPIFSATKPMVAAVAWTLITEGALDPAAKVTDYFPQWAADPEPVAAGAPGKADITVEQIMLHTCGFPRAPMPPDLWPNRQARVERMRGWRLAWEPGTRHEYHASSAHWVLAELIDSVTEGDPGNYADQVEQRITGPMGLPRLLGFNHDQQANIAELTMVGEPATADELEAAWGIRALPPTEVTAEAIIAFNAPDFRAGALPGGGGIARASDIALFYQQLLHNTAGVFDPEMLADVTGNVRSSLPDPFGTPCNRSLGLVIAGDDGRSHLRGMGRTASPRAFGHNGAGGQIAFADPATGISFCYLTNGYDVNEVRQRRRGVALASLAASLA